MSKTRGVMSGLVSLLVALGVTAAFASDFTPAATVLKMHVHIEVDARGLETIDETLVTRIERKDAVSSYANRRIEYSPKMHRVEILEAYSSWF